jgi:mannan endo-1,4-beta-mannosidase
MKIKIVILGMSCVFLLIGTCDICAAAAPSDPNATPEAKALLELFYKISGKYTLTGQHNFPNARDRNSRFYAREVGKTPVIWSSDFGFAEDGDKDSYLARPDIVKEAIRQHKKGAIVNLCWHAVPPTADEPVTFQPIPGTEVAPDKLASVQGRLTEEQYRDLMTPGTPLRKKWEAQVDEVAKFLKQLQDANVPVVWRPYHEMNGDWFWWGGRTVENGTSDIYRLIYDRYVKHHQLHNLVWVWSVDRPSEPYRKYVNYYPGDAYLDILALDVYGSDFKQEYYEDLLALSNGKPMILGEVGPPPALEVLEKQPKWASWVIWSGMVRGIVPDLQEMVKSPRLLSMEDPEFLEVMNPYRESCGLPPLPLENKYTVDFSGRWLRNEDKGTTSGGGMAGDPPFLMIVDQDNDALFVKKYSMTEYGDDQITREEIKLDGSEMHTTAMMNAERIATAGYDEEARSIRISASVKFSFGEREMEMKSTEEWTLKDGGNTLEIVQTSAGFRGGENRSVLVFEKSE